MMRPNKGIPPKKIRSPISKRGPGRSRCASGPLFAGNGSCREPALREKGRAPHRPSSSGRTCLATKTHRWVSGAGGSVLSSA